MSALAPTLAGDAPRVASAITGALEPVAWIELLDRDGAVAHRVAVTRWPVRIGRSLDCEVILDDPHAAAVHATLEPSDDGAMLSLSDSLNGARLGRRVLAADERVNLRAGSEWHIGRSRLRLRLPGEALPPELPLPTAAAVHGGWLVAGLLVLALWLIGLHWIESDPGDPASGYLSALLGLPALLAAWSFAWALGAKLFTRHFDFLAHLRWALGLLLLSTVIEAVLPLLAFATSWEGLVRIKDLLPLVFGCWLVYGHLRLILPMRRQALAVGFATMLVVGAGLKLALQQQRTDRWFTPLYLSTLGPPPLRLAPLATPDQFIDSARSLREPLERRARDPDSPNALVDDD